MMPRFLRPEVIAFAIVEIVSRITDSAPPPIVCAWCPEFDPAVDAGRVSHGICAACKQRVARALDEAEAAEHAREDAWRRDELTGTACGNACGYCGMCS